MKIRLAVIKNNLERIEAERLGITPEPLIYEYVDSVISDKKVKKHALYAAKLIDAGRPEIKIEYYNGANIYMKYDEKLWIKLNEMI